MDIEKTTSLEFIHMPLSQLNKTKKSLNLPEREREMLRGVIRIISSGADFIFRWA
jgi:hypothetical protein